jgi:hypothetical protein
MMKKTFLGMSLLIGAVAFLGCDGKGDSGETGTPADDDGSGDGGSNIPTETTISAVAWSCSDNTASGGSADVYDFEVTTDGWSTGGALYAYQNTSSPWDEIHSLDVLEDDSVGYWSRLGVSLTSVYPDPSSVVEGSTTLYACGKDAGSMEYTLGFVVEVDDDTDVAVDCAKFGYAADDIGADDCPTITAGTLR